MTRRTEIRHQFVEFIPRELEDGVVYISIPYNTVVHACCCGCGGQAVNPLSPKQWRLTYDGKSISLYPSVGNWSFACQSHYWIENSKVRWAPQWSQDQIQAGRARTAALLHEDRPLANVDSSPSGRQPSKRRWWRHWRRVGG